MAPVGVRGFIGFKCFSGRNSWDQHPDRSIRETVLATVIERQIDLLPGVEHPVTLHVQVAEVGPAATRCAGTVDDAPPLLRIPRPHDPAFSHLYIMTQRSQYRLTAPALALPTCLHCGHDGDERLAGCSAPERAPDDRCRRVMEGKQFRPACLTKVQYSGDDGVEAPPGAFGTLRLPPPAATTIRVRTFFTCSSVAESGDFRGHHRGPQTAKTGDLATDMRSGFPGGGKHNGM